MKTSGKKLNRALKIKAKISSERPKFNRSEYTRFPRLGNKWRSSKGIRSKMRIKKRSRAAIVETGYRSPVIARNVRADGRSELMVYRVSDLSAINNELQVARICGEVGKKKRLDILAKAEELNILIVNKRLSERKAPKAEGELEAAEEKGKEKEEETEAAEEEGPEQEEPKAEETAKEEAPVEPKKKKRKEAEVKETQEEKAEAEEEKGLPEEETEEESE